eukprot:TRINITY_DN75340_c0_g1_i1.p1 TRINITY_DN75340_c0_g1~~TRINITY_DN75340_c0_g1_i1.p1  ORF type:complete len:267 (-),score=21.02 TRINITY_DN75340_c0_g1_i1:335-1135(-)
MATSYSVEKRHGPDVKSDATAPPLPHFCADNMVHSRVQAVPQCSEFIHDSMVDCSEYAVEEDHGQRGPLCAHSPIFMSHNSASPHVLVPPNPPPPTKWCLEVMSDRSDRHEVAECEDDFGSHVFPDDYAAITELPSEDLRRASSHGITTMMIQNLPRSLMPPDTLREVDLSGYENTFDIFYMPFCMKTSQNKGFAFINFVSPEIARMFASEWDSSPRFAQVLSYERPLKVSAAAIQGREANLRNFEKKKVHRIKNPLLRPLIRSIS